MFDEQLRLAIANHGAAPILGEELDGLRGGVLADWPAACSRWRGAIREGFTAARRGRAWQQQLELRNAARRCWCAARAAGGGGGYVVVFDDVTQLIQAQRATAWAEVARRLAHEIKNPLTPIQLSAERLQTKLAESSAGGRGDAARATETIVNQVSAMKGMVDDFRDYARMPAPTLQPLDLNALVREVLALYEHSQAPIRRGSLRPCRSAAPIRRRCAR